MHLRLMQASKIPPCQTVSIVTKSRIFSETDCSPGFPVTMAQSEGEIRERFDSAPQAV
jgi:hypothetical protein